MRGMRDRIVPYGGRFERGLKYDVDNTYQGVATAVRFDGEVNGVMENCGQDFA